MMGTVSPLALVFLEPIALVGLAAPLVLVALGLRRQDSRQAFLGTTRFFGDEASGKDGQRKRSLPAWLLVAALAVGLGVLALAKPGYKGPPPEGVVVEVRVDRSPSMYLPHRAAGPGAALEPDPTALRRIDVAWQAFCAWAGEHGSSIDGDVFVSMEGGEPVLWEDVLIPSAPATAAPEEFWAAHDAPSTIWITDRAAVADARQHAGLFASGGDAVPGPVSLGAEGGILWKADGTTEFRAGLGSSGQVFMGPGVPSTIAGLIELWADARGVELTDVSDVPVELKIEGAPPLESASERAAVRAGRDGWEADLAVAGAGPSVRVGGGWTPWLLNPLGQALVSTAPGRVELGFFDLVGAPTDEAAFAVSWVGLFDRARLAPTAVVEASERRAAGAAVSVPPSQPATLESPGASTMRERQNERAAALRALLAGAAALLGLVALVLVAKR